MLIIHHNDADGISSAAIVYNKFKDTKNIDFMCYNYGQDFDFSKVVKNKDDLIIIVDLNFKEEIWSKLLDIVQNTHNIIWIDHHLDQSDLTDNTKNIIKKLEGVRKIGDCAALLTYKYFYNDLYIPMSLELIDQWDTWKWKKRNFMAPKYLNLGLKLETNDPTSNFWRDLIFGDKQLITEMLTKITGNGKLIDDYLNETSKNLSNNVHFEVLYGLTMSCINSPNISWENFPNNVKKSDILCSYFFNGRNWVYSFSSTKTDVKELVDKMLRDKLLISGGGHKGAAGGIGEKNLFSGEF